MPAFPLLFANPGSGQDDPEPVASLEKRWRLAGIDCEILSLDNAADDDSLQADFRTALSRVCRARGCEVGDLVLGGFSRGARVAAMIAKDAGARALLCLAYPFHLRGDARTQHGLEALRGLSLPTLIVQGSRDAHGNREEVRGYALPSSQRLHWLEDGNHRWQPRQKSGQSKDELMRSAALVTIDFIRGSLLSPRHE